MVTHEYVLRSEISRLRSIQRRQEFLVERSAKALKEAQDAHDRLLRDIDKIESGEIERLMKRADEAAPPQITFEAAVRKTSVQRTEALIAEYSRIRAKIAAQLGVSESDLKDFLASQEVSDAE